MKFEDLQWVTDNLHIELPKDKAFAEFTGKCTVDGKLALPLYAVSSSYQRDEEIEVLDEYGQTLGALCLCKDLDVDLNSITEFKYVAYVDEIERDWYFQPYRFKNDYLILDSSRYEEYKNNYMETAPLWGGIVHQVSPPPLQPACSFKRSRITAVQNLALPTTYHLESCVRSVVQAYAFERFLKLYHLLELLFDFDVVKRIQALGDDLKGVGQIFSAYGRGDEFQRLQTVVESRCKNFPDIADALNGILKPSFLNTAKLIFFEYSKDGNPYKDKEAEFYKLIQLGGFNESNAKSSGLISSKPGVATDQYQKLLLNTTVYWIYRTRCSIVHSRIGEYVMTNDDEQFVSEFAEPLLRAVLLQAFRV